MSNGSQALTGEFNRERTATREIREMRQASARFRDELLGADFFKRTREFFRSAAAKGPRPTFRPEVRIPQLQTMMFQEAADLTDGSPRIYIFSTNEKGDERTRVKQQEECVQSVWEGGFFNLNVMIAVLWSLFAGTGPLQWGYEPGFAGAEGKIWLRARDPETYFPDPSAEDDDDMAFVIAEDQMYPADVERLFAQAGPVEPEGGLEDETGIDGALPLTMPEGPMRAGVSDQIERKTSTTGLNQVTVTYCWERNYSVRRPSEAERAAWAAAKIPVPSTIPAYPNGRLRVTTSDGRVRYDDVNPIPGGHFPFARVLGLPSLSGPWGLPPVSLTESLQSLAGRLWSQVFENVVRTGNVITAIDAASGLKLSNYGGLPGERVIINPESRPPTMISPPQLPAHIMQAPQILLQMQRDLQGFNQSRAGSPGAGNVSSSLFESSVAQGQGMTRLRSRMLTRAVERAAQGVYDLMAFYWTNTRALDAFGGPDPTVVFWNPSAAAAKSRVKIDPGSLRPVSQTALRMLAIELRKLGVIDARHLLKTLEVPDADEIADALESEEQLAALARVKRR